MTQANPRPVLLVGSVPLNPASEVFRCAAAHLAGLMTRCPDGEQVGWLPGVWRRMAENPALAPTRKVALVGGRDSTEFFRKLAIQYYAVKPEHRNSGLALGPYGIAENAIASYRQFKRMKDAGEIPASDPDRGGRDGVSGFRCRRVLRPRAAQPPGGGAAAHGG
jgi:hypothetical protein